MRSDKRQAFTMVELLVTVAIIAVLASILCPVFARAREKAKQASCQSNLRQLSLGLLMYADDNEGEAPVYTRPAWYTAIYPYVQKSGVYVCPGIRSQKYKVSGSPVPAVSYGLNEPIAQHCCHRPMGSMEHPAETLLLGDCISQLGGTERSGGMLWRFATMYAPVGACQCPSGNTQPRYDQAIHDGGSNIAMADGHVKWIRWDSMKTLSYGGTIRYRPLEW